MNPDTTRQRWSMALRGFLCQNVAIGCLFGTYAVTLVPLQEKFGTGRGGATLGLSAAMLGLGFASPFVASLVARLGLRTTMVLGILLSGAGYVMLAFANDLGMFLAAFGLLIGPGLAMFGNFPSSLLASAWFRGKAGLALGFVNTPLLLVLAPLIAVPLLRDNDLAGLYLALAAVHLLLLPAALGIAEPGTGSAAAMSGSDAVAPARILARPLFWAIVISCGLLNSAGLIRVAHLVALSIEQGIAERDGAMLLSIMGFGSVFGSLAAGIICAAFGPGRTLALVAALTGTVWLALLLSHSLAVMAVMSALAGAAGAGVFPALNMLMAEKFGQTALPRTIGLYQMLTLPFTFLLPPMAGVLHDRAGSYAPVIAVVVVLSVLLTFAFPGLARQPRPIPA